LVTHAAGYQTQRHNLLLITNSWVSRLSYRPSYVLFKDAVSC